MYITELYEQVKQIHGNISRSKFCLEYLGTDRNYMNVLVSRGSDISERAQLRLYRELKHRADTWQQIAQQTPQQAIYNRKQQQYLELSEAVISKMLAA